MMPMAQCQQLYELQKIARLIRGKKTPESSRGLEARVAMLEAAIAYSKMKSPKLIIEIIQPLSKREVDPDRAMQILDG